ncbi:hypothetical protein MITS9509_00516 [Synechococcus sp. MIT S9509]|nr:hypothetical protein MITS9509_00516 [Synechococcus sp. MIT S9509]
MESTDSSGPQFYDHKNHVIPFVPWLLGLFVMSAPIKDSPMVDGFHPRSDHVQEAISDTCDLIKQIMKDFKQDTGCDDMFVADFLEHCTSYWRCSNV